MAKGTVSRAVVWVILLLLIVGLMGFGAVSFTGGGQTVASVGKSDISAERYGRALQNDMRALSRQAGQPVSFAQAQAFGLDRQVLSRLISEAAVENETASIGLSVGDETVGEEILTIPAFQGLSGTFDRDSYAFTLRENGLSVGEFEDRMRAEISARILNGAVGSGLETPDLYTQTLFAFAREQRDVTYARLDSAALEGVGLPVPSDADLRAFYEATPEPFTRPETRLITYVSISPDDVIDTIDVDEALIVQSYEARADEFNRPERRLVERLIFLNAEQAEAAKARLDAGELSFDELVVERGLTLADIDLGDVSAADLGAAADGVFELEEPGIVGPLPSAVGGPALYRMNAVLAPVTVPLDDVRDELRRALASDQATRIIRQQTNDYDDLLVGGATLEELAQETDMVLGTAEIAATDLSGDGLTAAPTFREAALAATESDFPELLETADGTVFALRLDEIQPPALRPLDEIRADVEAAFVDQQTADALEARANELATEISGGREMAGLGLSLQSERGLFRDDFDTDLTPTALSEIFDMDANDVRVVREGNEVTLIRLDAITAADPNEPTSQAAIQGFAAQTAQSMSEDVLQYFNQSLIDTSDLQINSQALSAIHTQIP